MDSINSIGPVIASVLAVLFAYWLGGRRDSKAAAFDLKTHNDEVQRLLADPEFAKELKRSVELEAEVIAAIVAEIGNLGGDAVYEREDGYQPRGPFGKLWASITEADRQTVKGKLIEKVLGLVNEFAKAALGVPTRR